VTLSIWRATVAVDRSRIALFAPLRALLLCTAAFGLGVATDQRALGIAASIGILFAGILDLGEPYPVRWRAMLWATFWCTFTCWLGSLVSGSVTWHVIAAGLVALGAGYAGSLGPHGALSGLVALVVYTIYSGAAVSPAAGLRDALVLGLGGAVATAVAIAAWPLGRFGGTRTSVGAAFRTLALAWQTDSGLEFTSPAVASAVVTAGSNIERSGLPRQQTAWLNSLVAQIERSRLVLVALSPTYRGAQEDDGAGSRPADASVDPGFATVAGRIHTTAHALTLAIARAMVFPPTRRKLSSLSEQLRQATSQLDALPSSDRTQLLGELSEHLQDAARLVADDWPPERSVRRSAPRPAVSARQRLRSHWDIHDLYVGHAVRLAVAIVVATVLSQTFDLPHSYWLPLTVAWLAKPDLAGTVTRIPARVLGTVIGVSLAAALLWVSTDPWLLAVWASLGAAFVLAFLWANYAVAVVGITVFVMVAFALAGQDERGDVVLRVLATLTAAVLVAVIAFTRPHRGGATSRQLLARTCSAMRDYAQTLADHADPAATRTQVLKTRTAAAAAIGAAAVEPSWGPRGQHLDAAKAREVLDDLMEVTSGLLSEELLVDSEITDPAAWQAIDENLAAVESLLNSEVSEAPPTPPHAADLPAARATVTHILDPLGRAQRRLTFDALTSSG